MLSTRLWLQNCPRICKQICTCNESTSVGTFPGWKHASLQAGRKESQFPLSGEGASPRKHGNTPNVNAQNWQQPKESGSNMPRSNRNLQEPECRLTTHVMSCLMKLLPQQKGCFFEQLVVDNNPATQQKQFGQNDDNLDYANSERTDGKLPSKYRWQHASSKFEVYILWAVNISVVTPPSHPCLD